MEGAPYCQVSAGNLHTVLLRSDGRAVAVGCNDRGRCDVPILEDGVTYSQVSAGGSHTVFLLSDGSAVAHSKYTIFVLYMYQYSSGCKYGRARFEFYF